MTRQISGIYVCVPAVFLSLSWFSKLSTSFSLLVRLATTHLMALLRNPVSSIKKLMFISDSLASNIVLNEKLFEAQSMVVERSRIAVRAPFTKATALPFLKLHEALYFTIKETHSTSQFFKGSRISFETCTWLLSATSCSLRLVR